MDMQFRNVNALGVIAISCVLAYAEYSQLLQHELPCPLCLLQRIGFVAVMFCLLLNVIYGSKAMHYSPGNDQCSIWRSGFVAANQFTCSARHPWLWHAFSGLPFLYLGVYCFYADYFRSGCNQ